MEYCKQKNHCIAFSDETNCLTAKVVTGNIIIKARKIDGKRFKSFFKANPRDQGSILKNRGI